MPDAPVEPVLEPRNVDEAYESWKSDPTPENMGRVVGFLNDSIGYKLSSMGVGDSPQMRYQARLFAADAVKKYDPSAGSSLKTWTQSQLQSLHRFRRENQGPVKVPDRAVIDGWALERARRELEDELGREPDVKQLADRSGLSVKRIATVRKATRPLASAEQMYNEGEVLSDFLGEALEYVYDESDPIDKKIIELTTGYGGGPMMSKVQAAARLGISPAQVTRRSDRISRKVMEMDTDLEVAYS